MYDIVMTISKAFPCRAVDFDDFSVASVNVEMDPTSEMEVRKKIEDEGLIICGWYHSHPIFEPDPSFTDVENQHNLQELYKGERTMFSLANCLQVILKLRTYHSLD